jgi:Flp pilus assembly pilin Flp
MPRRPPERPLWLTLLHDTRGTVMVEYVIVLIFAAVGVVAAMTIAGALLLRLYIYQRHVLLLPFP